MQRSVLSLVVGVILAVVAVALLSVYLRSARSSEGQAQIGLTTVVVAGVDLPFGTQLQPNFLKVVSWPADSVPKDAFQSIDEIFKGAANGGDRVVLRTIDHNEPITRLKISGFGGKATLSRAVSTGMRAVSISVNDVSGVAGFVLPGDRVDVMLTRHVAGGQDDNLTSDIILQNVVILGIDQLTDQDRDKPQVVRTVTVEVNPEDAQKLALAQQAGSLSLALRNADTVDKVQTTHIVTGDLVANAKAPPRPRWHGGGGDSVRIVYGDGTAVNSALH